MTPPSSPRHPGAPQPYPPQFYLQQHPPLQRPTPGKPPASALVGTLLAIAIGVGLVTTMCALTWRSGDDGEKVRAVLDATLERCAPVGGSAQTCALDGLHDSLREVAAKSGQPYQGFGVRALEIRCNNGDCDARVRGEMRFGGRLYPATFDLVDDGEGWVVTAWEDRITAPLLPD